MKYLTIALILLIASCQKAPDPQPVIPIPAPPCYEITLQTTLHMQGQTPISYPKALDTICMDSASVYETYRDYNKTIEFGYYLFDYTIKKL